MNRFPEIPVVAFVGFSGSGKTTLLKQLVALLSRHDVRVGLIKHAHHDFDIDKPGKDSYVLREAGASQIMVASARRQAYICENPAASSDQDPDLPKLLKQFDYDNLDIMLVEGFKHADIDKIEVHRSVTQQPLLYRQDNRIIAIATDLAANELAADELASDHHSIPVLSIDRPDDIEKFIIDRYLTRS